MSDRKYGYLTRRSISIDCNETEAKGVLPLTKGKHRMEKKLMVARWIRINHNQNNNNAISLDNKQIK